MGKNWTEIPKMEEPEHQHNRWHIEKVIYDIAAELNVPLERRWNKTIAEEIYAEIVNKVLTVTR